MVARLRSYFFWAWGFSLLAVLGTLFLALSLVAGTRGRSLWARRLSRIGLRLWGMQLRVIDHGGRSPDRPYLFIANHVSLFDPFFFAAAIPHPLRAVEVAYHFRWPLWGRMARRAGIIPIDERSAASVVSALTSARRVLRGGSSLLFLPEGTRTWDGRMNPFRPGPFLLAQRAGVDIVPIVQVGTFAVNNKVERQCRPGPVTLTIMPPIPHGQFASREPRDLAHEVRRDMAAALERAGGAQDHPPA